jgi:hypothetical protein
MTELIKIDNVQPLDGYSLRLIFSDGAIKEVDLADVVRRGGVLAIRDQREVFEQVQVNPQTHTVEWPGGVDLDAQVLYGRFEPEGGIRLRIGLCASPLLLPRRAHSDPTARHLALANRLATVCQQTHLGIAVTAR